MTFEIALVLAILLIAMALFISEILRADLVALLVLVTLAITGLVTPESAISGFSNPAVVTIWAMYILSEGLTRTGIGNIIGRQVIAIAGRREVALIFVIMLTGGLLSAFMNNIGVAALMLPVVVEIARRTEVPPSRLLMPLAFSTLLGGLITLIGTPPNLLISNALGQAGHAPFQLFDFAPVGLGVLLVATLFIALVGRFLLPRRDPGADQQRSQRNLRAQYGLQEWTFTMRIPEESVLVGRTLAQTRIGSAVGLIVIALERRGRVDALPSRNVELRAGDRLVVQGRLDRFNELRRWSELVIEREAPVLQDLMSEKIRLAEAAVADDSKLVKALLRHAEFRSEFSVNVLAIRRKDLVRRVNLNYVPLRAGDRLLIQGSVEALERLSSSGEFSEIAPVSESELRDTYRMQERTFVVRVPKESQLSGSTLAQSRLGDAFDFRLLGFFREGRLQLMPESDEVILGGDLLLIQGRPEDLDVLRGLQELEIQNRVAPNIKIFESDRLATVESTLAPNSPLAGRRVDELNLREKYGLELVAIWRSGGAIRADIERQTLQFGDALLLVGPRQKLALLRDDPDLLLLTQVGPATGVAAITKQAPYAALIMLGVVLSVLAGFLPIFIAAILGASLMIISGCLNIEQAYRAIEWRAVFLIAGMLPLGIAIESSGAALWVASLIMDSLGQYGPWPVIIGLYLMTAIGTIAVPATVLAVLMSPIVISASVELGFSPQTAMMALAVACTSLISPISHPANILVMGPGGYRFVDYFRLGIPLSIIVFITAMLLLPITWPLDPLID
ncbi:MAG: SLC13 family permease [Chromatiales bacterium]|nr:SLC13 family permease [Chromatiales bacterium]